MPTPFIRIPDPAAIERWLAGESAPEEADLVSHWVAAEERRRHTVEGLKALDASAHAPTIDVDALWCRVQAKLEGGSSARPVARHTRFVRRWMPASIASAIAVLGIISVYANHASPPRAPARTYTTTTGQRAIVQLSDGSRLILAPRSVLRVEPAFGARERRVTLDGEASFEVAHANGAPFIVRTGAVSTRVLGTTFLVRHYAGESSARIAVRTGKVVVTGQGHRPMLLTLTAGRGADVTDSGAVPLSATDVEQYAEWVDGRLVFRNAPAPDVLAAMRRWYGYEFRLADSTLAGKVLTVALSTESSRAALASLKLLLDVDLKFAGDTIVLSPRQPSQPTLRLREDRREWPGHTHREVGR